MRNIALRSWVAAAVFGLTLTGAASAATYSTLDAEASSLAFRYSQMNVKMDGAFNQLQANEFSFNPDQPEAATVIIEVPLASIDAGYDEANAELGKEEWLNTGAHPVASFRSTKVETLEPGRYQVTGDLSIKGNAKEITLPVTFTEENGTGVFEGSFTFPRADFGVGEGQWKDFSIVANEVEIQFKVVAKP